MKNARWGSSSLVCNFWPATLYWKTNPFTGLVQSFYLDYEKLLSSFGIHWTLFTDTSGLETAIRNYGKILKNQLQRSSFLSLIKLNASNFHLLKMNSIRGFSRILSKFVTIRWFWIFRTPILENTSWWLLLYVLEALIFSEHLEMAAAVLIKCTLIQIWKSPYMLVLIKSNTLKISHSLS